MPIRRAAEVFGISKSTIHVRMKSIQKDTSSPLDKFPEKPFQSKYTARQVFSVEQENQLMEYLIKCSQMNYGLTYKQCREFAFVYSSSLNLKVPESWNENKIAGTDWMKGFMKRHQELSLRKPENTSLARSINFNVANVKAFMDNYEEVLKRHNFTADKIFNVDETGITTVMDTPRVIAQTGVKQVGQIASAERGELVTVCCIVSAVGNTVPPVYVFPRKRYRDNFLKGAPTGSLGLAAPSGWMNADLFLETVKHFQKHVNCSKESPVLLLLDNHESHVSLQVILYCKDNGIVLLTFPPHCSHRLQPLDVAIYGPFKSRVKEAFNAWLLNNPGKRITIYEIAELSASAYISSFTMQNIISGFAKPGLWPVSRVTFTDDDFLQSYVTDLPPCASNCKNLPETEKEENDASTTKTPVSTDDPDAIDQEEVFISEESSSFKLLMTPEQIRPFPKVANRKNVCKKRKLGRTRILTDTPEKNLILEETLARESKKKKSAPMQTQKKKNIKRVNIKCEVSSDESLNSLQFSESDSDTSMEDISVIDTTVKDLQKNDFILVQFPQKKRTAIHYVARIEEKGLTDKEFIVRFLRRSGPHNLFTFPAVDDISTVETGNIVMKLPQPSLAANTSSRTGSVMTFGISFDSYDVR